MGVGKRKMGFLKKATPKEIRRAPRNVGRTVRHAPRDVGRALRGKRTTYQRTIVHTVNNKVQTVTVTFESDDNVIPEFENAESLPPCQDGNHTTVLVDNVMVAASSDGESVAVSGRVCTKCARFLPNTA